MKTKGSAFFSGVLAMAGSRSPWGSGGNSPEPGDKSDPSGDHPAGAADPQQPGQEPDSAPDRAPGPRNPWLPTGDQPPRRSASIEDIFRSTRSGTGGGGNSGGGQGGGFPRMPSHLEGKNWLPIGLGLAAGLLVLFTSFQMLGPKEQGVVTIFGKYSRTIGPGVSVKLPWPIEAVEVTDVTSINKFEIPEGENEKLMLTSDKNLVDLGYLVRWNIKDLKLYKFRMDDPKATIKEVAEAAMRASVAEEKLNDVIGGNGRGRIEQNVRKRMQGILDAYRSGILIQGVGLTKTDPPQKVVAAFQNVNVAQQDADKFQNQAQAWANSVEAIAQGEAAAFDKVYAQYKLAPEVTKRRLYYETMERVLRNNEKVVVEANGVTPYLPLPEVKRKALPAPAQSTGAE